MPRTKQKVNTSWARRYSQQGSNLKLLDEIEGYDNDLQREIQASADRTARLEYDIEQTRADRRFLEEDPEGYAYEKEQQRLENSPKTFGNYLKNWWNTLGRQQNDFQIGTFQGYKDRADQWERLANSTMDYLNIQEELEEINNILTDLNKSYKEQGKTLPVTEELSKMLTRKKFLEDKSRELQSDVEAFKTYIPNSYSAGYHDLVAGNGKDSWFSNNFIFGRTGQAHDELGDITRFTSTMFSPNRSISEQKRMLQKALDAKENKVKEWQEGIDANIKDRESYGRVDRWFKNREQAAGTDIFDSNTWLYKMPGLIAGTSSGFSKIVPAMVSGALTGAAVASMAGPEAAPAGAVIGALGTAGTYLLNYAAGVEENNSEISMSYNEKLEDYLKNQKGKSGSLYNDIVKEGREKLGLSKSKASDEQIFELYRRGSYTINNAEANKKMAELAIGIESQFQDDMAAVTWGAGFQTALDVIPYGRGLKLARPLKYTLLKGQRGRQFVRGAEKYFPFGEQVKEGFKIGSSAGPLVGAAYAPAHILVSPIFKYASRGTKDILSSIARTASMIDGIPSNVLKRKFFGDTAKRYFKDIAGRWALSSIEEGVEEGKQYISSEKYKNGYYTDAKIKSIGETLLDDFLAGSKSAGLLLGMPFEGFMSENDRRILQEIKGGMLLGGLQTAIVNSSRDLAPFISEQKAENAIINTVLIDKATKIDNLNKAKIYAEAAKSSSAYNNMLRSFDRLRQVNNDYYESSGEYGVTPEHIDEEEKEFKRVAQLAIDGYTIKQAKAQGIEPGTKLFNKFVAAKAVAMNELEEQSNTNSIAVQNLNSVRTELTDQFLDDMLKQMSEGIPGAQQQNQEQGSPIAQFDSAEKYNQLNTVAQYTALLRNREHLELGIINAERNGNISARRSLQKRLKYVNSLIDNMKPVINKYTNEDETIDINNIEAVETKLTVDKQAHDKLTEAYRQQLTTEHDLELAFDQYERVIGEAWINDKKVDYKTKIDWNKEFNNVTFKNGHAEGVFRDIQNTIDDDNDLASSIDRDFENRTDENGNEIATPEQEQNIENTPAQNNPEEEFKEDIKSAAQASNPVVETTVEPIQSPSKPVSPTTPTTVPETPKTPVEESKKRQIKITPDSKFNVDDLDFENNYYVAHQTLSGNLSSIGENGLNNTAGLNGTALFANRDSIVQAIENMKAGKGHRGSTGLVLFKFPKNMFSGKIRNLDDISTELADIIGPDALNVTPAQFVEYLINVQQENVITHQQQSVLDALKKKAEESQAYVKGVTPEYYIIDVNGTEIQMPRMHSIMPKYWADDGSFMPALQVGNSFDNLARIFLGDKSNITTYETNKDALVDRLFEEYASHKDNPNDPSLKKLIKMKYSDLYGHNRLHFEQTIDDLYQLAKQYQRLGWELSTDPIVWYSNFSIGWVAEETDMLAVDRDGNIHIIDFKTTKAPSDSNINPFGKNEGKYSFKLPTELEEEREGLNESDFQAGPRKKGLSKNARQFIRNVRRYLAGYDSTNKDKSDKLQIESGKSVKVHWNPQTEQAELRWMNSPYTQIGAPFRESHVYNKKTKGSKQDEYSDQLTAYKEMVQRNLGNVIDMEVVGFRVAYTYDDATNDLIQVISMCNQWNGKPFRVKVGLSDEMGNIFNVEGDAPEFDEPIEDPVVEQQENNEAEDKIVEQELQKQDRSLVKPEEPKTEPSQDLSQVEKMKISGTANINDKVVDRDHPELGQAIALDKQFISDAISDGTIEIYTETVGEGSRARPYVYIDVAYKGKTYKRIYVWDNPTLIAKVQALEKIKQPGQKLVVTNITRTNGKILPGKTKPVLESSLIDQNIEDLEFTSSNKSFGWVKNGKVISFVGSNKNQQDIIGEANMPNGALVYMKRVPRQKSEGGDKFIPVGIQRQTLYRDADFIIDCLKKIDAIDLPYITTIDGKEVSIGATRRDLLNLLIPYKDGQNNTSRTYSIVRHQNIPSVFYIVDAQNKILAGIDFRDEKSIDTFKESLQNIRIVDTSDTFISRIGSQNAPSVFQKIKKFFATTKSGIKSLNISGNLKFDFEDFKGNGLSGIGWYVKHNMLVSDFSSVGSPKMSICDVGFAQKKNDPVETKQVQAVEQVTPKLGFTADDIPGIGNWGALYKHETIIDSDKKILTKEEVKKRLRPILGDLVDDPNILQFIDTIANDPRVSNAKVVGKATSDAVVLYNEAFEGVDYHEAFHRIFELFVPEKTRDSIYKNVAKRLNIDLSKSTKENDFLGHRQVAEWLADMYMNEEYYRNYTNIGWLDRILNTIRSLVKAISHINQWQLYKTFLAINSGVYKNKTNRLATKQSIERFNSLFKELNYEIHGVEFDHIANDPMYEELKNTAFYCMLLGQDIDVSGATVQNTEISAKAIQRGADRLKSLGFDIFGTEVNSTEKSAAQLAMTELVVKFDSVADDFAARMASISTDYRKVMQNEGREDADGGESQSSYDENFMKWSYEFNRFDKTTSRVKFFFATIPDFQYTDEDRSTIKYATNSLGLPQLVPMNYVFNEVLSNLWDVDTIEEVVSRLSTLAIEDPMYAIILNNLQRVINGRINKDGSLNADNEALLAQLMSTIRSNRHTFMLLRSVSKPEGVYDLVIQRSDADYNARVFPIQWSQVLAKGGSSTLKLDKHGKVIFNPDSADAVHNFRAIALLFKQLIDAVSSVNNGVGFVGMPSLYEYEDTMGNKTKEVAYIEGRYAEDLTDPKQCKIIKNLIVEGLNSIGINIHTEEFDYMLRNKYGSSDWEALRQMVQSTDETDSINSFLYFLQNITKNGKLNINENGEFINEQRKAVPLDSIYSTMAFVKELGNWKYEFRHAHDQLSVLATGGNRFYEMSDNDYMSDVLRDLNKRGKFFRSLKEDPYNYYIGDKDNFDENTVYGSITLKQLTLDPKLKIALKHFIGFKSDKKGDEGQDYFEISKREDYLSKVGILENGGMVSLTLSDKKKYVYISGIKLPGLDYTSISKSKTPVIDVNAYASQKILVPDNVASSVYNIEQKDEVIDQMISYAMAEYQSILNQIDRLHDGHRKIVNFDNEEQCLKFSSLLGIWEQTFDKEGKPNGEQYISFNDSKKSWEENLSLAEAYFFSRPIEEQKALMARILTKRTESELDNAVKLGLIKVVNNNKNNFINYKNVGLNNKVIQSIKMSYLEKYKGVTGFTDQICESLALTVYLNDISNKAIMSGQEMERLYSGNPAFYKWKYDDNGNLIDRTVDELKRLGGLGSTGNNNFTQLKNIPVKYLDKNGDFTGKYICAEVDNEEVSSPQFEQMSIEMYEGQLRQDIIDSEISEQIEQATFNHEESLRVLRKEWKKLLSTDEYESQVKEENQRYLKEIADIQKDVTSKIDEQTVEQLEELYPSFKEKAKEKSQSVADAIKEGIDVADGGAYISDDMCELLLRMEGAYSTDIQEAFKILRGEVKMDYLGQIEAYSKVLTSVIGNQKYTAFGRRQQNGTTVPYYHKMALFPIFDCIATGKMRNIFDKMKEQNIDMLLVNSAVKVGSEGSKPITWSDYRQDGDPSNESNFNGDIANQDWKPMFKDAFAFNTYECDFDYLRKQLNTDPKEEEMLRMGTQMQKIVYSNLYLGRTYTTQSGEPITGKQLLDRIMNSSNALSDIGVDKINKKFFVTNENGDLIDQYGNIIEDEYLPNGEVIAKRNSNKRVLDIVKFSKEVSRLMSERGADKNIMRALELVTSANKDKSLSMPLGAISNANWLESVLISTINKDVVDVNTPGSFFIQRSVWAMEGMKLFDGKTNVKGDLSNRSLYNGKRLQMVNEEGSMDCVISIDFYKHILPQVKSDEYELDEDGNYVYETDKDGNLILDSKYGKNYVPKRKMRDMTFDEARAWLIKKGIIGGKANIVAYRIPTQAESSIHALRVVDVIPVVRDTVILPEEFTRITGSDFDIDKLGLSTMNFKRDGSSEYEQGSEKYYQNQLIKDYITLLIDQKTRHILHRSIDNDTKLLKDVVKEIQKDSDSIETPYGFYSLSTQTERKDDYITGKIGIGPFALNNNSHILTMLYGVKFKEFEDSIMTELGLTDLSGHLDKDGNSIMSWLSALINAHVDIAKDPYISKLNVNSFTYNLVNTLIRTGLGKKTFYFTTQPIMKKLAEAYNNAGSSYMADPYKSKWQLQKDAVADTAKELFEDVTIAGLSFDKLVEGVTDPRDVSIKPTINAYIRHIFNSDVLLNNANRDFSETVGTSISGINLTAEQVQLLMYLAYLEFEPYATSVSNLVKYSKIDTKKHGKSYIEQQAFLKGFNKLFNNVDGGGLFEQDGLDRLAKQSYIELKTINAISMTENILKGQFLQATNAFKNAMQQVLNMIGKSDSLSVDLWNIISQAISASIKSEYINEYAKSIRPNNSTYIHDLVSESEEELQYTQSAGTNRIKLESKTKYPLETYLHKRAYVTFVHEDTKYERDYTIVGYDSETNEIIVDKTRKVDNSGTIRITGGENTIYDRFNRLFIELRSNPQYKDILDNAGEPVNMLLKSLVVGKTFSYKPLPYGYATRFGEDADTYETLKFVKLFNALDQNGIESNYIIDAWDQLLHDDKHPLLKEFAEDLVVYSFVTSGDQGGFTKFFKQVPFSWRKESGYADFIQRKLVEFQTQEISTDQLEDAILNNWYNSSLVPKYNLIGENRKPNFMAYSSETYGSNYFAQRPYPTILAALRDENGILTPTIDPETAPLFIKIPRRKDTDAKDSQRRVTVYKRASYGMRKSARGEWIHYPIYVKVEPKGNLLKGNFLMTEYGREDAIHKEYTPSEDGLKKMYQLGDFISRNTVEEYAIKYGELFAQMIEDLNYQNLFETEFSRSEKKFTEALNKLDTGQINDIEELPSITKDEYIENPSDNSMTRVYNLLKLQYSQSPSNSKLTDLVFNALKDSGVEFVAEDLGPHTNGRFVASENKILYNSNPEYIQANTLLHEAIHAATSYYLRTANRDKLPQEIRIAIEEIEECYSLLKDDFIKQNFYENGQPKAGVNIEKAFEFWIQDDDTYGYTSPTEMVAELGKPSFVEHIKDFDRRHKGENVFQRLISAIAQLFGITKEYKSLEKTIKDALVVLLTNPNKELIDRYAKENNNIKVNYKALNDCNHINFENRRVIGEIVKELPEDTDDEYFDTVMKLPKDLAAGSLQVPQGAHHPLTQSHKGAVFVFERCFFFTLNGDVTIDDEFVNVPIRIYSEQGLQNNVFEISTGENGIDYVSKVTPLFEDQKNLKQDVHGNYYGWSVQSIYNRLYSYIIESTGYSDKEKLSHVKKINALYGTNFRAFKKDGVWQLLNNTNSKDKLKLSENPNVSKQLELFEGIDQDKIRELKKEAEEIKKQCKGK